MELIKTTDENEEIVLKPGKHGKRNASATKPQVNPF